MFRANSTSGPTLTGVLAIVVYAIAREGEELAKMGKARGAREAGTERGKRRGTTQRPRRIAEPMTLKELGINKNEASRAQRI